jgi:hypothetical protein
MLATTYILTKKHVVQSSRVPYQITYHLVFIFMVSHQLDSKSTSAQISIYFSVEDNNINKLKPIL